MTKPENRGAITVTIKGPHAALLRDLMNAKKLEDRKIKGRPEALLSYADIVRAALLEFFKGEIAELNARRTRTIEQPEAKPQDPF